MAIAAAVMLAEGSNMPLVEVELDGVRSTLILDTGASHTTFDLGFVTNAFPSAQLDEVTLLGRTNVRGAILPRCLNAQSFKVGEMNFAEPSVMVLPLGQLSEAVGRRVDGILGMNHLLERPFMLSLADRRIVWDPSEADRTNFVKAATQPQGNRQALLATLPDGGKLALLIDSGSSFTFIEERRWRWTEKKAGFLAADVNGKAKESPPWGERGKISCGIELELEPIMAPHPGLNQIGAQTLLQADVFFNKGDVWMRRR